MKSIVILCISDLHFPKNEPIKKTDNTVGTPMVKFKFIEYLKTLNEGNSGWLPDYICLTGDLVSHGRAEGFEAVDQFLEEIYVVTQREIPVLMAPGNHDMEIDVNQASDNYTAYFNDVKALLSADPKIKDLPLPTVKAAFKGYSAFRKKWIIKNNLVYKPYNKFQQIEELNHTTGCIIFDQHKIAFMELNNTWRSVSKDPLQDRRYNLHFGKDIILNFKNLADELKKKNYFIVSLFHHPLYYLGKTELMPAGTEQFCVYDHIIQMSDLCISGHLHGAKIKTPDLLGNKTQYVMSGAFRDESNNQTDYSASLIRISPLQSFIEYKILSFDNETQEWRDKLLNSYLNNSTFELPQKKIKPASLLNPKSIYSKKSWKPEIIFEQIVRINFGSDWRLSLDKESPIQINDSPIFGKITNALNKNISRDILFIDILCHTNKPREIIHQYSNRIEKNGTLLIVVYGEKEPMLEKKMMAEYNNLIKKYRDEILAGKKIFIFTFNNTIIDT